MVLQSILMQNQKLIATANTVDKDASIVLSGFLMMIRYEYTSSKILPSSSTQKIRKVENIKKNTPTCQKTSLEDCAAYYLSGYTAKTSLEDCAAYYLSGYTAKNIT
uniref:Uncharacterized protein n=1 Tax=Timema cristinae TaxID=61476 RepID=A0A7R9DE85_TIMCR|nr:unnamed protein product [Timema cristinae]